MPHPVVVSKILLQNEDTIEKVRRAVNHLEALAKLCLELVVVLGRSGRVELLELTHAANAEASGQLLELPGNVRVA
jgi:hypothetical protein